MKAASIALLFFLFLDSAFCKTLSASGQILFEEQCSGCHGNDAIDLVAPRLMGQDGRYLKSELSKFRGGARTDNLMGAMNDIASSLSDEQMQSLVDFLSHADECTTGVHRDPLDGHIPSGKRMFEYQVCWSCHFAGNKFVAPNILGQKTDYLKAQLTAFRDGERKSRFMNGLTQGLSDQDLADLAAYVNSAGRCY